MSWELVETFDQLRWIPLGSSALVAVVTFYVWRPTAERVRAVGGDGPRFWLTAAVLLTLSGKVLWLGMQEAESLLANAGSNRRPVGFLLAELVGYVLNAVRPGAWILAARALLLVPPLRADATGGAGGRGGRRFQAALTRARPTWILVGVAVTYAPVSIWEIVSGSWAAWGELVAFSVPALVSIFLICVARGIAFWAMGEAMGHALGGPRRGFGAFVAPWFRGYAVVDGCMWFGTAVYRSWTGVLPISAYAVSGFVDVVHECVVFATVLLFLSGALDAERAGRLAAEEGRRRLEEAARVTQGVFAHLRHTLRGKVGLLAADARLLGSALEQGDLDDARVRVAAMTREVGVLQAAVIPLLTAAPEAEPPALGPRPAHDLGAVLAQWASQQRGSVRVAFHRPPSPVYVGAGPVVVQTVLHRLLENAVGHGGATSLTLTLARAPGAVVLEVANDGTPLPREVRPTLFLDPTRGLGAAFVLLAREGARIAVGPEGEATFWVTFPVDAGPSSDLPAAG